ncbi:MAG TPA: S-layer homology domain-containing protein, partial [Candidatus Peribacteraceae bacterium]|nr:S-layer homology domain-containing protein [Candidatus Peribacteraceae bacterium]
ASGGGGGSRRGSPGGDGLHSAADSAETSSDAKSESERSKSEAVPNVRGFLEAAIDGQSVVFTDVPVREWFAAYVWDVIQAGIASGYRDARGRLTGEFSPANPVTYAEIAKMALEAAGEDVSSVSGTPVNRTAQKQWSESYIKLAEELQLSVYARDLDVNGPATRGAVVQTIVESFGLPLSEGTGDYSDLRASHPHAGAIDTATALGIISGDTDRQGNPKGTVRPDDLINRAEVAKILTNVLSLEP